ncbi:MAG: amino acid permease [Mycobacteriaceae bacterium]|nr:amino acid permease [Mycobacteriaceae bacterium]
MFLGETLRRKPLDQAMAEAAGEGEGRLRRDMSALDLTILGVGVIVGTGIFVLTGTVARNLAGPAAALSFVIAGAVCGCAALCYAEFASTVPVAGSAYSFSYSTLGELPAWIIGWALTLELTLATAVVSVGWAGYLQAMLAEAHLHLPDAIAGGDGSVLNLPAALLVLALCGVLMVGGKLSKGVTNVLVAIKLGIVLLVIVAGLFYVSRSNYHPFIPPAQHTDSSRGLRAPLLEVLTGTAPSTFGVAGILSAAAMVFFAYIGFDLVATTAEETRNPQRDMPIGIIGSLAIVTVLYVAVTLVVTGMQHYSRLSVAAPLADAFTAKGAHGFATVISVGAVIGLIAVSLICYRSQSRVLMAMARDGLLPAALARLDPRFGTPRFGLAVLAVVMGGLAAFVKFTVLAELVNIGTLFAFAAVSAAVLVLRRTAPDLPRAFRTPMVPAIPLVSLAACVYLMLNLQVVTWIGLGIWTAAGLVIYLAYGRRHSHLAR